MCANPGACAGHGAGAPGFLRMIESRQWQVPSGTQDAVFMCATGKRSMRAAQAWPPALSARLFGRRWLYRLERDRCPYKAPAGAISWRAFASPALPQVGLEDSNAWPLPRASCRCWRIGFASCAILAAAGVGHIRIVDDDVVERSNLQRQILHTEASIGTAKVESARRALTALNPSVEIEAFEARLDAANVESLIAPVDVVIDGADNFPTRYLLSDACVKLRKPLVYGAVHRFEGHVSLFDAGCQPGVSPCYRCLFPSAPDAADAPNCSEAGVLGVLQE